MYGDGPIRADDIIALLGLDGVRFTAPVRLGDEIRVEVEILEKRATRTPNRGLVKLKASCKNLTRNTVWSGNGRS